MKEFKNCVKHHHSTPLLTLTNLSVREGTYFLPRFQTRWFQSQSPYKNRQNINKKEGTYLIGWENIVLS